jgi:hypothetical protein
MTRLYLPRRKTMDANLKKLIEERVEELELQLKNRTYMPGTLKKIQKSLDENLKMLGRKRDEK